jgi:RNA polymerase sigma factor (sigma-70 family)
VNQRIGDIWAQVRDGDHEAWRALVERYAPLVYTVALRIGLTKIDAEDCAQHTWMALYRNRRVIKDPSRIPFWLIQTTRRQAVRMIKLMSRHTFVDPDPEVKAETVLPDEEMAALERQAILEIALDRLDGRCAELLRALFFAPEAKSYREIAKGLGIAPNTLGPLRSRCLERLRKVLEELGYETD